MVTLSTLIIDWKWLVFNGTLYVGSFYVVTSKYGLKVTTGNGVSMGYFNLNIDSPNVYFDTINGADIVHSEDTEHKNWLFTENKTISLFGKHSILVPKDSSDTNIDLYVHNIVLKDNAETTTKKIYITIQSTMNTKATTKELLTTLLGSTARYIRVSGYTATNDISAINWTGTFDTSKYDVRGTEILLTDFAVIEDSVVTLK